MADPSAQAPQNGSAGGSGKAPDFWRRTPPALFPALFGLFGLGLAWRAAAQAMPNGVPPFMGEAVLAIASLLYLFCFSAYISKISYRLDVIFEDILTPPGRAGAATMTLCLFLFSAALAPYAGTLASVVLWIGLLAHSAMAACALLVMSQQTLGLKVTPAWHLSFVGFILAPLAAVPLGWSALSWLILLVTLVVAFVLYLVSLMQLRADAVPAPMRPLLVVHLAPVSLFATVCGLLGWTGASLVFVVLATGLGGLLASRVLYLTAAGFSPMWGAFTFPVAALATALFTTSALAAGLAWLGLLPLVAATLLTPYIAARIVLMWINGTLAAKTGAGIA